MAETWQTQTRECVSSSEGRQRSIFGILNPTIAFAVFLSSIWWIMRRFVGGWLSGALTAFNCPSPLVGRRLVTTRSFGDLRRRLHRVMVFAADFHPVFPFGSDQDANAIVLGVATMRSLA